MKKIYKLALFAIVVSISWSYTGSASLIEDLGTVEYNSFLQVDIISTSEVNLSYVYSSINPSVLGVDKLAYIPVTNTTRYLFTSELYYPGYWENLSFEPFIFQDDNTKDLYVVIIDMTEVEIPEDPWKIDYLNLSEIHNEVCAELNETVSNLTKTRENLNDTSSKYVVTSDTLNITLLDKTNLTNLLADATKEINKLTNQTKKDGEAILNATSNASIFRRFYEQIVDPRRSSFSYKIAGESEEYTTIYGYENEIDNLEKQLGGMPFLIIFMLAIAITICFMAGYWKWGRRQTSPEEMEYLEGVSPETTFINRFKSRLSIGPKHTGIKEKMSKLEGKQEEIEDKIKGEYHDEISKIVDDKMKIVEARVDGNFKVLSEEIKSVQDTKEISKTTKKTA